MSIPILIPLPRTRKSIKITMAVVGFLFLAGAIIGFCLWLADQKMLEENGQPDFGTLSQDALVDDLIVTGAIDFAIDCYAEEYETGYFNTRASDRSRALYYLIPVYGANADGPALIRYFITFEAKPDDFNTMNSIVAQTWDGSLPSTPLEIENAEIAELPGNVTQCMSEWANEHDFYQNGSFIDWCAEYNVLGTSDRTEIASRLVPYMIRRTSSAGTDLTTVWVFLGFAVLSFGIMLIMIFVKAPIKGVEENPAKDNFSQLRDLYGSEGEPNDRSDL